MAWLRMARRFTRGGAARLALTVLAVAWGVALVAAVHLANRAVLRAFVEVVDTMAGRAALEVVAGEGGLFPEDVAAAVATVPGVEASAASVKGAAFADGGTLVTVYGVDLTGDVPELPNKENWSGLFLRGFGYSASRAGNVAKAI